MSDLPPDLRPCPGARLEDLDMDRVEAYREELNRRRPGLPLIHESVRRLLVQIGAAAPAPGSKTSTWTAWRPTGKS